MDCPRYCVLFSGGVESCVLVGMFAETGDVFPFRLDYGLRWETEERAASERYLHALAARLRSRLRPLTVATTSVPDTLRPLWSLQSPVPSATSPDAAVELPRRNRLLLEAAAEFCSRQHIPSMAIGTLVESNPFADATPSFFHDQERILSRRYQMPFQIMTPFRSLRKAHVILHGTVRQLPLEHSLSCLTPLPGGIHCGACNKCGERRRAFQEARVADPTKYAAYETRR